MVLNHQKVVDEMNRRNRIRQSKLQYKEPSFSPMWVLVIVLCLLALFLGPR